MVPSGAAEGGASLVGFILAELHWSGQAHLPLVQASLPPPICTLPEDRANVGHLQSGRPAIGAPLPSPSLRTP